MKTLILSSIVLLIFSVSILIFQISCKKTAVAQSQSPKNDIILLEKVAHLPQVHAEYWLVNLDGTNFHQVSISLPSEFSLGDGPRLSADGSAIIFPAVKNKNTSNEEYHIYKCQIDGSNVSEVVPAITLNDFLLVNDIK